MSAKLIVIGTDKKTGEKVQLELKLSGSPDARRIARKIAKNSGIRLTTWILIN